MPALRRGISQSGGDRSRFARERAAFHAKQHPDPSSEAGFRPRVVTGVDAGLAIVGVLTYRLLAFWLPVIPGVVAYVQLLRGEPSPVGSRSG